MPDFSQYTYLTLLRAMLDRVPDSFDKRDTSPIPTALGPAAWALEGFYLVLSQVQRQGYIQTATGEALDQLAVISGAVRSPASAAVRLGIFNMAVPIGARFSTVNGENSVNFTVTASTDNPLRFQLTAETAGAAGNEYTGPILPITTIPGLTSAQITDILIPGEDEEDDTDFRERIEQALSNPSYGGNISNYREWTQKISGVGPVQVYPTWSGGGTVKLSVLGADFQPASDTLVSAVQEAIDPPPGGQGLGLAPIGAAVSVVAPVTAAVNVAATLTLVPGFTLDQVRAYVLENLTAYLLNIRQDWGTPVDGFTGGSYNSDVYLSRVSAAILAANGVRNVSGVTLNGAAEDLALTETSGTQQVPVLGTVTLT